MPETTGAHVSGRGFWVTLALLIPVAMAGGVWLAKRTERDRLPLSAAPARAAARPSVQAPMEVAPPAMIASPLPSADAGVAPAAAPLVVPMADVVGTIPLRTPPRLRRAAPHMARPGARPHGHDRFGVIE